MIRQPIRQVDEMSSQIVKCLMFAHNFCRSSQLFNCLLYESSAFKELSDIRAQSQGFFRNIEVDESSILNWKGLIVPVS